MNKKAKTLSVCKCRQIFIYLLIFSAIPIAYAQTTLNERLEQHVYTLASDSMQGRKAGTEHARMAAGYITNQWKEIGIEPFFDNAYLQPFGNNWFQNVVGIIHGNDPVLKNEYIIIGAHYDHIGTNIFGRIRNGADDNASGVAALIELGRELKQNQSNLKRSVILIAFDAEEIGLIGSTYFINHWETSITDNKIENIKLMISIDMVGWYEASGKINYIGSGTIKNGNEIILNSPAIPAALNVAAKNFETNILVGTDTHAFAFKRIPTLNVTTGLKSPYHTSRDEAHLIDFNGMALIVEHLKNFIETISQEIDFEPSGRIAKKHKPRRCVDIGVSAHFGMTNNSYTADNNDKNVYGFFLGAGFSPQINLGIFAIRPELHYDYIRVQYPFGTINENNLTVPLNLVLQTPDHWFTGADIFFGGYYSYCLNDKQGGEAGLTFGLGSYLKPFKIGFTCRIPLTDFRQSANINDAHIKKSMFYSIVYTF